MIPIKQIKDQYGNELALIILTCRVHFQSASEKELDQFIEQYKIDWNNLVHLCRWHRIRIVVYRMLTQINLPPEIHDRLKKKVRPSL